MKNPTLTVVVPVFNGEKYLKEAVESILNQTFSDFELIIINDGSTDKSIEIINDYTDTRIRLIDNKNNFGIAHSRNLGLEHAKGEFLTWTDCDDINNLARFEEQINFLKNNIEFGACGTWLIRFGSIKTKVFRAYRNSELVKATLLFKPSMPNATVMLRLASIRQFKLQYNEGLPIAEDYDFILRCSMCFPLTNIPKVLYKYRDSETSIMKHFENKKTKSDEIHKTIYVKALNNIGLKPSEAELTTHRLISSETLFNNFLELEKCYEWLNLIKVHNNKLQVFNNKLFNRVLADQFLFTCKKASKFGLRTLKYYLFKSFSNFGYAKIDQVLKLTIRCIIRYDKF